MSSPKVKEIVNKIIAIHEKKSADYAKDDNPFSNFERAALLASWFDDPVDKVFVTMLGIKLARLAELLNGKSPKNESIEDSFLDYDTYAVLWYAYYLTKLAASDTIGRCCICQEPIMNMDYCNHNNRLYHNMCYHA